ncbi:hypothetical protein K8I28_00540 [bacterium]|nr:hypothetical protein [bacterium]
MRQQKIDLYWLFPLVCFLFIIGCNAPRENPLDPSSDNYSPEFREGSTSNAEVQDFCIRTIHRKATHPQDLDPHYYHASARISDPEGIDFVLLEVADSLHFLMNDFDSTGSYLYESPNLKTELYRFVGTPFRVIVHDQLGNQTVSEKEMITRIITEVPQPLFPGVDDEVDPRVVLTWRKHQANYSFTYGVQVVSHQDEVYYSRYELPAEEPRQPDDTTSLTLPYDLPTDEAGFGTYFWTVSIEDKLGNESVSRLVRFSVRDTIP